MIEDEAQDNQAEIQFKVQIRISYNGKPWKRREVSEGFYNNLLEYIEKTGANVRVEKV